MPSWISYSSLLVSVLALMVATRAAWLASTTRTFRGLARALRECAELVAALDVHAEAIRKLQLQEHARAMTASRKPKSSRSDLMDGEPDPDVNPDAWKRWAMRNPGAFRQ